MEKRSNQHTHTHTHTNSYSAVCHSQTRKHTKGSTTSSNSSIIIISYHSRDKIVSDHIHTLDFMPKTVQNTLDQEFFRLYCSVSAIYCSICSFEQACWMSYICNSYYYYFCNSCIFCFGNCFLSRSPSPSLLLFCGKFRVFVIRFGSLYWFCFFLFYFSFLLLFPSCFTTYCMHCFCFSCVERFFVVLSHSKLMLCERFVLVCLKNLQ